MQKDITIDKLDPARTALVLVHMVKRVAGKVDTPFNRIFRARAEKTGIVAMHPHVTPSSPARGFSPGPCLLYGPNLEGTQKSETPSTISTLDNKSENQNCNPCT